jgi:hypothetical protein
MVLQPLAEIFARTLARYAQDFKVWLILTNCNQVFEIVDKTELDFGATRRTAGDARCDI